MFKIYLPLLLLSFTSFAGLTPDRQKCATFVHLAQIKDGTYTRDASSALDVCQQFSGDIVKICSDKKYSLCSKKHQLDDFANVDDKLFKHHIAALFLNMPEEYQKKRISELNVASNNRSIEECVKKYEHQIITKTGQNFLTLFLNSIKPGAPLFTQQETKIYNSLNKTFESAIDDHKRCFKNAKEDESIAMSFVCSDSPHLWPLSSYLNDYCQKAITAKKSKIVNPEQITKCNTGIAAISLMDYVHKQNIKIKKLKRAAKYCEETSDFDKTCSIVKLGLCKHPDLLQEVKSAINKKNPDQLYEIFIKKFMKNFAVSKSHPMYRNEAKINYSLDNLKKTSYINNPELCSNIIMEATDYLIDMQLSNFFASDIEKLAFTMSESSKNNDSAALSLFIVEFNKKFNKILTVISENATHCQKQAKKDLSFFNKKMCSRYEYFLKKNRDSEIQKICR